MKKPLDVAKKVWDLMAFQYLPLEKRLIADLKECNRPDLLKQYNAGTYAQKIKLLDKYAQFLGY